MDITTLYYVQILTTCQVYTVSAHNYVEIITILY